MKRPRTLIITTTLTLATLMAIGVAAYAAQDSSGQPPASAPDPTVLTDKNSQLSLSIQLAQNQPDTGRFDLTVPGAGLYRGTIPLQFSGKQIAHARGTVTATFRPLDDTTRPSDATIRMEGEINTAQFTSSVNVWVNDKLYKITTKKPDTTTAATAVQQTLAATNQHDWAALYSLMSAEVQAATSQTDFAAAMSASDKPVVLKAATNGAGVLRNTAGYNYYIQPVTLTVREPGGSTTTYQAINYFVEESGGWRLLTTDTPKQ